MSSKLGGTNRQRAAIGFKAHTGWAAAVVLAGPSKRAVVVSKHRVDMEINFDAAAVYHAAQEMPTAKAQAVIPRPRRTFSVPHAR